MIDNEVVENLLFIIPNYSFAKVTYHIGETGYNAALDVNIVYVGYVDSCAILEKSIV